MIEHPIDFLNSIQSEIDKATMQNNSTKSSLFLLGLGKVSKSVREEINRNSEQIKDAEIILRGACQKIEVYKSAYREAQKEK